MKALLSVAVPLARPVGRLAREDGPLESLLANHVHDPLRREPAGVVGDPDVVPLQIDVNPGNAWKP